MVYELSVGTHYLQQASKKGIDNRQVISRVFADEGIETNYLFKSLFHNKSHKQLSKVYWPGIIKFQR